MEKIDRGLLKKCFEGQCNKKEQETVVTWFVEDNYNSSLKFAWAEHFNQVLDREEKESDRERLDHLLDRVHHRLDIRASRRSGRITIKKLLQYVGRVAAVLFLPLLLASGIYFMKHPPGQGVVGYSEIVVPKGARIHFELPDGTQGWLNSESILRYPLSFTGKKKRMVALQGEGYFKVTKNEKKPFIVKTDNVEVMALGTRFDVNAYPDEDQVEVTLLSGKVEVLRPVGKKSFETLTFLEPGEQVRVRKVDGLFQKTVIEDPSCYVAWKDGKLIFRNDPMAEVVKKLGRWYNVEFLLQEQNLRDYRYHATFQYESLDEVLKLIRLTSPVDYKIIERKKLSDGTFSKKRIIIFAKKDIKKMK